MRVPTIFVGAPIALQLAQNIGRINLQLFWFEVRYLRVSFLAGFAA